MGKMVILMKFLDESRNFSHGFECGKLYEAMQNGQIFNRFPVNKPNEAQIRLICETLGYECDFEYVDEFWMLLSARPVNISEITNL